MYHTLCACTPLVVYNYIETQLIDTYFDTSLYKIRELSLEKSVSISIKINIELVLIVSYTGRIHSYIYGIS